MAEQVETPRLRLALVALNLGAIAAIARILLAPTPVLDLPNAGAWPPPQLPGYRLQPLPGMPAEASRDLAHGPLRRWRLEPITAGQAMQLTLVQLHSRSHEGFSLEAMTRGVGAPDGMALNQARWLPGIDDRRPPVLVGQRPAGPGLKPQPTMQTCVVSLKDGGLTGGVSQQQLTPLVERRQRQLPLVRSLAALIGLQPPLQWTCTLISLGSTGTTSAPLPNLEALLQHLLEQPGAPGTT